MLFYYKTVGCAVALIGWWAERKIFMLSNRTAAKEYLKQQDRPHFLEIVYKAKVTPIQKQILYMALLDKKDHGYIGDMVGLTRNSVDHEIGCAYDAIYRYMQNTVL